MVKIENDAWRVTLTGRFGDFPPSDRDGFLAFARSLWTPRLYEILKDAEWVTGISHYRFPTSVWRRYEQLENFPQRFLVVGDAISSFNPVYGQGMSAAALQVCQLQTLLKARAANAGGLDGLPSDFFRAIAEVVNAPWTLAAGTDLAFPETRGERPPDFAESGLYFEALDAMTAYAPDVHRLLFEALQLAKPLSALSEEPLRSRVVAQMQKQKAGN